MLGTVALSILAMSAQVWSTPAPLTLRQNNMQDLYNTLDQKGLTQFSNHLQQFAGSGTSDSQAVNNQLSSGQASTLLAPSNDAFNTFAKRALLSGRNNDKPLAQIAFHVLKGKFDSDNVVSSDSGKHSIANSFLKDECLVDLGGKPQVQVLEKSPSGDCILVREASRNTTVTGTFKFKNIVIHAIDNVVEVPGDYQKILSQDLLNAEKDDVHHALSRLTRQALAPPQGFDSFSSALQGDTEANNAAGDTSTTILAPTNGDFDKFTGGDTSTRSLDARGKKKDLTKLLKNHIIPNTVLYSPDFCNTKKLKTASGEEIEVIQEGNDTYFKLGCTKVKVLRSDVQMKNGVIIPIDGVLHNDDNDKYKEN